ncbi:hypothetical protein F383_00029 [Gossypium arboreum]|uniref:Uncharacterized protein n=1 Tax=Gossypium arboreum TaxID=29729 RepID=A0A0B0PBS1_GOSAR|nr:hypothetical protein F383_00029 [Gossypium arboreum]
MSMRGYHLIINCLFSLIGTSA